MNLFLVTPSTWPTRDFSAHLLWCTRSFDISRDSAISLNFTLRLFKIILWSFLMFSGETTYFGSTSTTLCIVCVCTTTFKFTKPKFYTWLCWRRVRVIFIKPLFGLHSIFFPSRSSGMNQHTSFVFIHFFVKFWVIWDFFFFNGAILSTHLLKSENPKFQNSKI